MKSAYGLHAKKQSQNKEKIREKTISQNNLEIEWKKSEKNDSKTKLRKKSKSCDSSSIWKNSTVYVGFSDYHHFVRYWILSTSSK